jgi:hypothetical protein
MCRNCPRHCRTMQRRPNESYGRQSSGSVRCTTLFFLAVALLAVCLRQPVAARVHSQERRAPSGTRNCLGGHTSRLTGIRSTTQDNQASHAFTWDHGCGCTKPAISTLSLLFLLPLQHPPYPGLRNFSPPRQNGLRSRPGVRVRTNRLLSRQSKAARYRTLSSRGSMPSASERRGYNA